VESVAEESRVYEVMLPVSEEGPYSSNYMKILGVLGVVVLVLYFKLVRKAEPQGAAVRTSRPQGVPIGYAAEMEELMRLKREKEKQS
jgi:hypothetical protein